MLKKQLKRTSIFVMFLLLAGTANAQRVISGQVVDVLDGKTVVVGAPAGRMNVELQFIDVPSAGLPISDVVKEHLRALVLGKEVEFRVRYILKDRTVGSLKVNGVDISQQMLRDGAAWHLPARLSGQDEAEFKLYASTESAAKNEGRGVWGEPGLKPAWESPAAASSVVPVSNSVGNRPTGSKPHGAWGDRNPRLGNIGALLNGYNSRTQTGYLSTSFLGVQMKDKEFDAKLALDVTYLYKENNGKARTGTYIFTLVSESDRSQFLRNNDLTVLIGEKKIVIGRPERSVANDGVTTRETLKYRMSRETLEKLVNNDEAYLKVGNAVIVLTGIKYMLYNMLQLTN